MRRTTRGGLAATAALCAVAALPGTATAGPGDLPAYRTADGAEKVEGAASSADGPRLEKGGSYTDSITPGQKKYYSVELDDTSNAWISAVALPEAGSKVAFGDGIEVTLEDTDGTSCDDSDNSFGDDGASRPLATYAGRMIKPDDDCQRSGVYNFSVQRESDGASDASAWPLELRFMQEPGLKSITSTTPPETEQLPTEPPEPPTGEAKPLKGGTGFNDAAGMDEGVWKDRLRPGETRFYRVPVDWGQQLFVATEFGTAEATDETGFTSGGVRVDVYNPARGFLGSESEMYQADEPAAIPLGSPPVAYTNRYSTSDELGNMAFAGWYYIAVHAQAELATFMKGTVPVTLRTVIKGEAKEGPGYDGDAAAAGFGVTDDDREQAAEGLTAEEAERSDMLRVVAFAGIGAGTVLIVGLAAWMLLARRRGALGEGAPGAAGVPGAPGASGVPQQHPYPNPYSQQGHHQGHPQGQGYGQPPGLR